MIPNYVNPKERATKFVTCTLKSTVFPLINFVLHYNPKRNLQTEKIFQFSSVSTAFAQKQLQSLKQDKATGTDSLPSNLLKDCAFVIAPPLTHIINMFLKTSTFPSIWKSAKITPIYKSGNTDHVENYQPIPSMCLGLKICPRFEYAKKYDSYGHENKISNTTIINKFNNKTEILYFFSRKENNISSYYSLTSTK